MTIDCRGKKQTVITILTDVGVCEVTTRPYRGIHSSRTAMARVDVHPYTNTRYEYLDAEKSVIILEDGNGKPGGPVEG